MIITNDVVKSWRWRTAKAGKSIADLAQESGSTAQQLSNYLNERTSPNFDKVCKIEAILASWGVEYQFN